ncbi:hypothetical protein MPLA_770073 [Mesorhizobium sp. ORS 3359]|nr:hypothetical protein MPLA_770073 [Mesorhizobium sp. ORS 3359]
MKFGFRIAMLRASRLFEAAHDMVVDFRGLKAGVRHQSSSTSQRFDRRLQGSELYIVVMEVQLRGEFAQEVGQHFCRGLVHGHVVGSLRVTR